jgi:hypothetical protein
LEINLNTEEGKEEMVSERDQDYMHYMDNLFTYMIALAKAGVLPHPARFRLPLSSWEQAHASMCTFRWTS